MLEDQEQDDRRGKIRTDAALVSVQSVETAGERACTDLVYTLQVLPAQLRAPALRAVAGLVAPGGTLLLITRGRDDNEDEGKLPWPVTPSQLGATADTGLAQVSFEDFVDQEDPPVRRFRVRYNRTT